ncbi:MAG: cyclic pyranopterin monophosphate synthase MoaC [Planctomycetes bacterium]|nr:cyclic pyranopterin monophosphate synthase MoaC [Planctomycetota bacterium]
MKGRSAGRFGPRSPTSGDRRSFARRCTGKCHGNDRPTGCRRLQLHWPDASEGFYTCLPRSCPKGFPPAAGCAGTLGGVTSDPSVPPHGLTHQDAQGKARMVDVSHKPATVRVAVATARIRLDAETRALLLAGKLEKGEALAVARIAGIQAGKDTARLVPLCHPLALSHLDVEFAAEGEAAVRITTTARTVAGTGVEMEAMTAASVAALVLYDMTKARCRGAVVDDVKLLHKSGGKSGVWNAPGHTGGGA